jgi:hypothetical protein
MCGKRYQHDCRHGYTVKNEVSEFFHVDGFNGTSDDEYIYLCHPMNGRDKIR